jgi:hypothetical protein
LQELGIADNELRLRIMTQATGPAADYAAAGSPAAAFGSQQLLQWQPGQERQNDVLQQQQLDDGCELLDEQLWQDSWPDCSEEQWYSADGDATWSQPDNSQDVQQQPQPNLQQQQQDSQQVQTSDWQSSGTRQQGSPQQQGPSHGQQQHCAQHWTGGPMPQQTNPHGGQWWGQFQQQQQRMPSGPLQPLDLNQQQQATAGAPVASSSSAAARGSSSSRQGPSGALQSSITGFVVREARPQQQQQDAKKQWRALFKRPKQPLGAHNPAQREPRQAQLTAQGQVVLPIVQGPAATVEAAAAASGPAAALAALTQAPGPGLPRYVHTDAE